MMRRPLFSPKLTTGVLWLLCILTSNLDGAATTPNPGLKFYYPAPNVPKVDVAADIIVYGGTSGGVVAAVQAVRMGKSVALVVFGRHVGGMTSGGLTATDGVNATVQGGITKEYFAKTGGSGFKPSKAELEFENLLADPVPGAIWDAPVPTFYEQRLATVEKSGARIVALHMENGSVFRGRMFIDCSYEGDLMARAGVSYTVGRESAAQYGESRGGRRGSVGLAGVDAYVEPGNAASGVIYNLIDEPIGTTGSADDHVQAYNFRMYTVQQADPAQRLPLFPPGTYDPSRFEILYRYHRSGGTTSMTVGNDINNHEMFNRGCSTDHIGGNRWPDGNGGWVSWADADYPTRELIYQSHVSWQLGILWYLKTDTRYRALASDPLLSPAIQTNIQALLNKVDQLGFPLGEYPETGGWAHELYVREARRMVSDFVIIQAHADRVLVVEDSVGLANYTTDSHHVRRIPGAGGSVLIEGDTGGGNATPWRIPYRAMIPRKTECENLLVSWALSASHVAFCSTRMEPCLMSLSQSATTAAALAIERDEAVQDLPYSILKLQLLADGQILGAGPATVETGIIVDNSDASGFAITGAWTASSATTGFYGGNYLHDGGLSAGGHTATFTPNLPTARNHDVFLRWTSHANRAANVPVDIHHEGGITTVSVNQQVNGGGWFSLGNYAFAAGTAGKVVVRNDGATGFVIADAVKFGTNTAPPTEGGIHVIAGDPVADEETGAPGKFQFVRDTNSIGSAVTVHFSVGGTAVPGTHYPLFPTQVIIPANSRFVTVSVNSIADSEPQGTRTIIATILPDPAYTVGSQSSATVRIVDKRYDGWRHRNFSPTNQEQSAESAPGADPDGDRLANHIEFLLGTSPLSGLATGMPDLRIEPGTVIYEYWHRGEASGFTAVAKSSFNLAASSWTAFPDEPRTVQYDPATGDRLLRQILPLGSESKVFFRLEMPQP